MKINQLKYTEEQIKLFGEYYKHGLKKKAYISFSDYT